MTSEKEQPVNTVAVMTLAVELEAQTNGFGWDQGVHFWGLHAHAEDLSDLAAQKLGGTEPMDIHPLDLIRDLPSAVARPSCVIGAAISFECWKGNAPAGEDPNRVDCRFVVVALATGVVIAVEHVRDQKPKCFLLDPLRALAYNSEASEVGMALRAHLLAQPSSSLPPGLPPELVRLLEEVIGGGEGQGGFFIIGGGE